jgi:hypothetical protein
MGKTFKNIGVQIPQIWLPRTGVDLTKWAVIACDQFTAEPEYWEQVEKVVGEAPSTLRLFLPEIFLGQPGEAERLQRAQASMRRSTSMISRPSMPRPTCWRHITTP